MQQKQVIQYTAEEISEISTLIEKRDGSKPSYLEVQDTLIFCSKQIYPDLEIIDLRTLENPLRLIFEMGEGCYHEMY